MAVRRDWSTDSCCAGLACAPSAASDASSRRHATSAARCQVMRGATAPAAGTVEVEQCLGIRGARRSRVPAAAPAGWSRCCRCGRAGAACRRAGVGPARCRSWCRPACAPCAAGSDRPPHESRQPRPLRPRFPARFPDIAVVVRLRFGAGREGAEVVLARRRWRPTARGATDRAARPRAHSYLRRKGLLAAVVATDVVAIPATVRVLARVESGAHLGERGDPYVAGEEGVEGPAERVGRP